LDGSIVLRSFKTGEQKARFLGHTKPITVTAISKSNRWLATYANENEVFLWDLQTNALSKRFTLVDKLSFPAPVDIQLEFSTDDRLLAVAGVFPTDGDSNSVRIFNVADGSLFRDLCFDSQNNVHIGFAPEVDRIAAGSDGRFATYPLGTASAWSESIRTGGQVWRISFTADGTQLITSGDSQGVTVWDAVTFQKKMQFTRQRSFVECFSISPDGQTLATGGMEGTLRLWHFPTGQLLGTLMRHTSKLNWVKFVSNTKLLVGSKLNDGFRQGVFVFDTGE
jgi:WD40 repeat protein